MSGFNYRTILDISKCLSPNKAVFNPSIAHIVNTYYLISYRVFYRGDNDLYSNHPWNEESRWGWGNPQTIDETLFAIIEIDLQKNYFYLVRKLNDKIENAVDARVFKLNSLVNNKLATQNKYKFIIIYNQQVYKPENKLNTHNFTIGEDNNVNCTTTNQCTSIVFRFIDLFHSLKDNNFIFYKTYIPIILCSNISHRTEKKIGLFFKIKMILK